MTGSPREEADLQEFLARDSALTGAYAAIEPVQPPDILDTKILNSAKAALVPKPVAAKPAAGKPAPAKAAAEPSRPAVAKATPGAPPAAATANAAGPKPAAPPRPVPVADDDDTPPARRPRWLVPAAAAAAVLVAVGIGFAVLSPGSGSGDAASESGSLGSLFAKRAKARSDADQAAAASAEAAKDAEVLAPLPPPPIFEPEGNQIEDLDKAIALIRRELVMANQTAAPGEPAAEAADQRELDSAADRAATLAVPSAEPAAGAAPAAVIQPRDRRLAKILELYDGGNPDLAGDSLEIFLRDFEDDPISQRILETQPRATDVAVE
jgi:hypothetical protein